MPWDSFWEMENGFSRQKGYCVAFDIPANGTYFGVFKIYVQNVLRELNVLGGTYQEHQVLTWGGEMKASHLTNIIVVVVVDYLFQGGSWQISLMWRMHVGKKKEEIPAKVTRLGGGIVPRLGRGQSTSSLLTWVHSTWPSDFLVWKWISLAEFTLGEPWCCMGGRGLWRWKLGE